ncbi:cyanophycinase [Nocardioides terrisoli]|uniref:cyanophycinase n=1 Tax=Nocardioides terrisoli TaxID=3388267 RepID=UPI00287B944F|nr:cyanophycinase [Nocardioides marmorisolisilvae]
MSNPGEADPEAPRRGDLVVIGGAEDKLHRRTVLREFVSRSGGSDARIALIPTASSLGDEVVEVYDAVFAKLGVAEVIPVRPGSRDDASSPAYVDLLEQATGIFMTGGNQLKLSAVVCGTPLGEAIKVAHLRGVTVGGTSAGASIQSSHMVAFGPGGATPKQRMTQVAAGLGLLEGVVVDQHFDQRNRYGRLLMIVSQSPQLLGIGIDEDTAAVVTHSAGSRTLTVAGRGSVTVLDPARMVTNAYEAPGRRPILASGVVLHALPSGSSFDLDARLLVTDGADRGAGAEEAAEHVEARGDLRRLVRDVAAADTSPSALRRRLARRSKGAS